MNGRVRRALIYDALRLSISRISKSEWRFRSETVKKYEAPLDVSK